MKKYVDEAIEKGAENIRFDMDSQNSYLIFTADFTPEQFDKAARGNMEYYKVLSVKEFTAVAIQCLFDGAFDSEDDVTLKADELVKKHLKI